MQLFSNMRALCKRRLRFPGEAAGLVAMLALCGGSCRAERWPLWESYSARFLDGQGRVIDHSVDDRSTSEGEAYAMFFALVADDRSRFQSLLDWTELNMAGGDLTLRLPAWTWGRAQDGSWKILDPHSAADADLWMAYTLCEAGRLWHTERYAKLGDVLADRIAREELAQVPKLGWTLLPGAEGFHPGTQVWYLNPSYLPPMLLAYFAHRRPAGHWADALSGLPRLVATPGGFAMDWIKAEAGALQPSSAPSAEAGSPSGSYEAIRVYLWLGMADGRTRGVKPALEQLRGMALYLRSHLTPPLSADPAGKVLNADGPPGFSAAVLPYLHALHLGREEQSQQDRLDATKDAATGLYGRDARYYDQNLALFATGWSEGRFRFGEDGFLQVRWKN